MKRSLRIILAVLVIATVPYFFKGTEYLFFLKELGLNLVSTVGAVIAVVIFAAGVMMLTDGTSATAIKWWQKLLEELIPLLLMGGGVALFFWGTSLCPQYPQHDFLVYLRIAIFCAVSFGWLWMWQKGDGCCIVFGLGLWALVVWLFLATWPNFFG